MSVDDVKSVYVVSCFVLCLIIVSPTVAMFVSFPGGDPFSELWLLGENHMIQDYPFNVDMNATYNVYVGVSNHMGSSAYYLVYVKFRNQIEALPNATSGTPSLVPPLFDYRFFLAESETWEALLTFSFVDVFSVGNYCRVESIEINDRVFVVEEGAMWDVEYNGFYYQLFFELWLYNMTSQQFGYHDRFVGIWLNMTV